MRYVQNLFYELQYKYSGVRRIKDKREHVLPGGLWNRRGPLALVVPEINRSYT